MNLASKLRRTTLAMLGAFMVCGLLIGCGGGGGGGGGGVVVGATTGSIAGTVRDTNGNLLTAFAVANSGGGGIVINGSTYTITGVNAGTQTVTVSRAGFNTSNVQSVVTASQTTTTNVNLSPAIGDAPPPPPF